MNRGGTILTTGKIGYAKPVRQQIMMPNETLKCNVSGKVKMAALRERDALRINAHLAVFMTPIRWLEPNWTDYVREGPNTSKTISFVTANASHLGLGGNNVRSLQKYWQDAPLRVYNEWYKWPEFADKSSSDIAEEGLPAVNLEHSWTRCKETGEPDDLADKQVDGTTLTVQELAEVQARYRAAIQREVLSYERYQEILRELYGADGSREVDQVPIKVFEDDIGVNPRSYPATDSAGLGQWASLYDFGLNANFTVSAPEHCILTYMLTVRFAPISEEVHPMANNRLSWFEQVGDPSMIASMPPQPVELRDCFAINLSTPMGYLPAGWQWRTGNNIIGRNIDQRDSFPYMQIPQTAEAAKDATARHNAFSSQSLGDFVVDGYALENSYAPVPNAEQSFYVGMKGGGKGSKAPYPKTGKVK